MRTTIRFGATVLVGASLLAGCSDDPPTGNETVDPPSNVTVTATSPVAARVTFTPVSGATSYGVERAPGASGGTFAQVGTPTTSPFDDTGLSALATYRYRVKTISGTRESAFSAEASVTMPDVTLTPVTSDITTNTTWTADKKYRVTGFIHVQDGATLTIEPGTVIEGDYDTPGSSLFVLRGAKIEAVGTADQPIVFTSSRPAGQRVGGDWGGLIIVGRGIINRSGTVQLEGSGVGAGNPAVNYGEGTDNADDSGTLRYVRIEFAGFATATDQELNSLTLAAVGSGTEIDFVEAMNGLDDSFEFFGGAVDAKHLVSYNSGDDHFDMSEGYVGRLQFLIGFQQITVIPRPPGNVSQDPQGFENDGCNGANCSNGHESQPYNIPVVANFTLIGPPAGINTQGSGTIGMMLRRGTGGFYVNGLVARWARAAISLRDQFTLDQITAGRLVLRNLLLAENGVVFQPASGSNIQGTVDEAANAIESAASGTTASSLLTALPAAVADAAALDWTPASGSAAASGGLATFTGELATRAGTVVSGTSYRGAADPAGDKWWLTWTNYAED